MGYSIYQDITDAINNCVLFLPLIQGVSQASIDGNDVMDIPKHLFKEVGTTVGGDDI